MYRPQSDDTDEAADRAWVERLRALGPSGRALLMERLNRQADALAVAGIRLRHPGATPREVRLRLASLRLSADDMRRLYGWDPDLEGR